MPSAVAPRRSALLRVGAVADRLEHHLAAEDEFDGPPELPCRRRGQWTLRPGEQLAAEAGTDELADDANVFARQGEHLRQYALEIDDALRGFVERQLRAFPDRSRSMRFERILRLGGSDIGLIELDRARWQTRSRHRRADFAGGTSGRRRWPSSPDRRPLSGRCRRSAARWRR